MKRYQIEVSEGVERRADAIYDWLAARSPEGALHWYQAYRDALNSLNENPEWRTPARESAAFSRVIRQVLFKTQQGRFYRVLFVVIDETVHVVAIRGSGQDWAEADDLDLPD